MPSLTALLAVLCLLELVAILILYMGMKDEARAKDPWQRLGTEMQNKYYSEKDEHNQCKDRNTALYNKLRKIRGILDERT